VSIPGPVAMIPGLRHLCEERKTGGCGETESINIQDAFPEADHLTYTITAIVPLLLTLTPPVVQPSNVILTFCPPIPLDCHHVRPVRVLLPRVRLFHLRAHRRLLRRDGGVQQRILSKPRGCRDTRYLYTVSWLHPVSNSGLNEAPSLVAGGSASHHDTAPFLTPQRHVNQVFFSTPRRDACHMSGQAGGRVRGFVGSLMQGLILSRRERWCLSGAGLLERFIDCTTRLILACPHL